MPQTLQQRSRILGLRVRNELRDDIDDRPAGR
jgi:hypothetical protein